MHIRKIKANCYERTLLWRLLRLLLTDSYNSKLIPPHVSFLFFCRELQIHFFFRVSQFVSGTLVCMITNNISKKVSRPRCYAFFVQAQMLCFFFLSFPFYVSSPFFKLSRNLNHSSHVFCASLHYNYLIKFLVTFCALQHLS